MTRSKKRAPGKVLKRKKGWKITENKMFGKTVYVIWKLTKRHGWIKKWGPVKQKKYIEDRWEKIK